jgi:hypothetical protein
MEKSISILLYEKIKIIQDNFLFSIPKNSGIMHVREIRLLARANFLRGNEERSESVQGNVREICLLAKNKGDRAVWV